MKRIDWRKWVVGKWNWQRFVRLPILIYVSVALYAALGSDRSIFLPPPASYSDSTNIIKIPVASDANIAAIYLPNPDAEYTLLYSHGNAEDIGQGLPKYYALQALGFSVFAYDYRGYGLSDGKPSEPGVYEDINAAYRYLTENLDVPSRKIILYGRSVGGGPAVDLATREPVGGLILESTFVSAFRVLTRVQIFPFDKFANLQKIDEVRCPILILHGTEDEVVPLWHAEQLFDAATAPKWSLWVSGANHNDLVEVAGDRYAQILDQFVQLVGRSH